MGLFADLRRVFILPQEPPVETAKVEPYLTVELWGYGTALSAAIQPVAGQGEVVGMSSLPLTGPTLARILEHREVLLWGAPFTVRDWLGL